VDALDFDEPGIVLDEHKVGNSTYDPKAMLKLLVYGYSYGFRSSRRLERAVHHNVSSMWLMGNLKPDHKTIANFRKNNKNALKKVLKQCARLYIKLDLIDGDLSGSVNVPMDFTSFNILNIWMSILNLFSLNVRPWMKERKIKNL